jgi:hypothetical protein
MTCKAVLYWLPPLSLISSSFIAHPPLCFSHNDLQGFPSLPVSGKLRALALAVSLFIHISAWIKFTFNSGLHASIICSVRTSLSPVYSIKNALTKHSLATSLHGICQHLECYKFYFFWSSSPLTGMFTSWEWYCLFLVTTVLNGLCR